MTVPYRLDTAFREAVRTSCYLSYLVLSAASRAWYVEGMSMTTDISLLRAALIGYKQQRTEIDGAIADITARLGGNRVVSTTTNSKSTRTRKPLSTAARRRIAAAQKKRWAAYHKQHGAKAA